ncbi:hypothetical protein D9758_009998 [Tetrapyrgos nigripes]|uniref:Uncharacterized protein n=1 Tax=Tetrapyrgos nigripes TaxID=182062 RepID=A0A8H5CVS9_9AGAR|nr:hypothetical protein D9758_009998 [Tetrapyrgos nigripes]
MPDARPAPTEARSSISSDELTNRGVRIALYLRPTASQFTDSKLLVVILLTFIVFLMIVGIPDLLTKYHYLAGYYRLLLFFLWMIFIFPKTIVVILSGINRMCIGFHTAAFDIRQEISYNTLAIQLIAIAFMLTIPPDMANYWSTMAFIISMWCTTVFQRPDWYTFLTDRAPLTYDEVLYALLPCLDANGRRITIFLQKTTESRDYLRLNPDQLVVDGDALRGGWRRSLFKKSEIFVKEEVFKESEIQKARQWRWQLFLSRHLRIVDSFPFDLSETRSISDPEVANTSAMNTINQKAGPAIVDVSCIQLPLATISDTLVIKLEKREGNNDQFVVAIGQPELAARRGIGQIWMDIIPEVKENLAEIHESYKHPHKRADVIARGVDEVSRKLKNGAVSVTTNYIQPVSCSRQSIVGLHVPELPESNAPCCEVSVKTDEDEGIDSGK